MPSVVIGIGTNEEGHQGPWTYNLHTRGANNASSPPSLSWSQCIYVQDNPRMTVKILKLLTVGRNVVSVKIL